MTRSSAIAQTACVTTIDQLTLTETRNLSSVGLIVTKVEFSTELR